LIDFDVHVTRHGDRWLPQAICSGDEYSFRAISRRVHSYRDNQYGHLVKMVAC